VPFTPAHVVAALPFRRTRLVMSAVVMGCIAPDTPFFLLLLAHGFHGHTLAGMFEFDLPVGLTELWLYHAFIREPLLPFLPDGVRRRLATSPGKFSFLPPVRLVLIVISLLIGIATHLLWDSICHRGTWPYQHWDFLRLYVDLPVTGNIAVYKLLEYVSSLFGVAVVAIWAWYWYRTTKPVAAQPQPSSREQKRVVTILPVLAVVAGMIRAFVKAGLPRHLRPFVLFSAYATATAITAFLFGLLVVGIFIRRQSAAHPRPQ
jgi:hypothetical protein